MISIPINIPWRAIGTAALATAIFAAGWTVNGGRKDAQIDRMKTANAQSDLVSANKAIEDIGKASDAIRAKADEFNVTQTTLGAKVDAAVKEFRNAKQPLPLT
ncbi:hypothetical protein CF68_20100 [Cupriavidus sp. SK-4]|uniref:hypothetical protein n=1 Tax=Cupriavidus sp. SK-4 TaxID=574750 RepID=UPI000447F9ED|nr:hypothetical protein [Cupriavidus sp. SK-4]EYS96638.1 hypothetical protein CF68_20100 [Cupriavidus sp. SK-4]